MTSKIIAGLIQLANDLVATEKEWTKNEWEAYKKEHPNTTLVPKMKQESKDGAPSHIPEHGDPSKSHGKNSPSLHQPLPPTQHPKPIQQPKVHGPKNEAETTVGKPGNPAPQSLHKDINLLKNMVK